MIFEDVSNEMTTFAQKWWFRSRHPQKKLTESVLETPGAVLEFPGAGQEASCKEKLIDFRKYNKKLDGNGSILDPKTEPKVIKNQPQKLYNFQ